MSEPWKPSTALVTGGIFGRLRNPMYVGLTLLLAGLSILLASDWMLVMTIVFVPVIHFGVVKREERYLEAKFGDAYRHTRRACRATAGRFELDANMSKSFRQSSLCPPALLL